MGKPDVAQRLCGFLQVDIEKTRKLLGWAPPLSLDEGLKKGVIRGGRRSYRGNRSREMPVGIRPFRGSHMNPPSVRRYL